MLPALPIETWRSICNAAAFKQWELANIVLTSRTLAEIAKPLLYRRVWIQLGYRDSTRETLKLLVGKERLCKAVCSLSILGFWKTREDHSALVTLLLSALVNMVCLREVQVSGVVFERDVDRALFFKHLSSCNCLETLKMWSEVGEVVNGKHPLGTFQLSSLLVKAWLSPVPGECRLKGVEGTDWRSR
jgi:hypothetical protein